jgi:hypothetical protein
MRLYNAMLYFTITRIVNYENLLPARVYLSNLTISSLLVLYKRGRILLDNLRAR